MFGISESGGAAPLVIILNDDVGAAGHERRVAKSGVSAPPGLLFSIIIRVRVPGHFGGFARSFFKFQRDWQRDWTGLASPGFLGNVHFA